MVTNGQLTFTWQGTIPAQRLASDWKFVDALGPILFPPPDAYHRG
ncbi:hypothetical protein O0544_13975 [Edwardsiella anguillarum]|nr:hypothetical protein [Edwardsiella anguillarum]